MLHYVRQWQILLLVSIGLLLLWNYPILLIFNQPTPKGLGLYSYIFLVWFLAIVGLGLLLSYSKWFKE